MGYVLGQFHSEHSHSDQQHRRVRKCICMILLHNMEYLRTFTDRRISRMSLYALSLLCHCAVIVRYCTRGRALPYLDTMYCSEAIVNNEHEPFLFYLGALYKALDLCALPNFQHICFSSSPISNIPPRLQARGRLPLDNHLTGLLT